jgi:hypothetical protein
MTGKSGRAFEPATCPQRGEESRERRGFGEMRVGAEELQPAGLVCGDELLQHQVPEQF